MAKRMHSHQTSTERYAKGTALRKLKKKKKQWEEEERRYKGDRRVMNKYLSIIILNENGIHAPIKRQRVAEWIRKHGLHICCLQETHLRTKYLHRLKVKGWKIYSKQPDRKKEAGEAIFISDKVYLKIKAIKRDTKEHFIILKGRMHQEDVNIVNIYAPNIGTPKYIRKILVDFKKDIHNNTVTQGILIPHYKQ